MAGTPDPMSDQYYEEGIGDMIIRNVKRKPAVVTGMAGLVGACGYGYWRYKTKGFLISPSLFLMQLRVGAQGAVVGIIMCGMMYNMINQHLLKNADDTKKDIKH